MASIHILAILKSFCQNQWYKARAIQLREAVETLQSFQLTFLVFCLHCQIEEKERERGLPIS